VQPVRGRVCVDDVRALLDGRTRVVSVSFVDWNSGARTDLRPLGELCRERGVLFCVDGIQGVGAIQLDVERAGIDCLAVGGHKWLLALEGCGGLFISRRVVDRLQSVLHGWKSVTDADTYLPYHFDPRPDAAKFEPGSPPQLGTHALGTAIELLLEVGPAAIEQRLFELTDRLAAGLRARGAEIVSPWEPDARSGILVFRLGSDAQRLSMELIDAGSWSVCAAAASASRRTSTTTKRISIGFWRLSLRCDKCRLAMASDDPTRKIGRRRLLKRATLIVTSTVAGAAWYKAWKNSTYLFLMRDAPKEAAHPDSAWQGATVRQYRPSVTPASTCPTSPSAAPASRTPTS